MKTPGGNNPTYWATLRLACEGVDENTTYRAVVEMNNDELPFPSNSTLLSFARSLILKSASELITMNKSKDRMIENQQKFGNKLFSSGLFS